MPNASRAMREWRIFKKKLGDLNRDTQYMRVSVDYGLPDRFLEEDCRRIVSSLEKCDQCIGNILREMK